jgi:hypothetical protein
VSLTAFSVTLPIGCATPEGTLLQPIFLGDFSMKTSSLLLSTAIGLTLAVAMGASGYAGVSKKQAATGTVAHFVDVHLPAGTQGKVKGSLGSSGFYGATSSTAVTQLDSETVNCKAKKGSCVLEMSAMIQQCSFTGEFAANLYAVQALVDGNYVDNGPYAGGTSTSHPCDIQNWQGIYPVGSGDHTVVFNAYESSAAYLAQWSDRTDVISIK